MTYEVKPNLSRDKNEHIRELQIEIGKILFEGRTAKGYSLEDVEGHTKISRAFIQNIEAGEFDKLPGKIFGRGFIKNISKFLQLDTDSLLETFEKSWIYTTDVNKETPSSNSLSLFSKEKAQKLVFAFPRSIVKRFFLKRNSLFFLVPFFILICGILLLILRENQTNSKLAESTATENTMVETGNEKVETKAQQVEVPILPGLEGKNDDHFYDIEVNDRKLTIPYKLQARPSHNEPVKSSQEKEVTF